ncbi:transposase [Rhizobium oryzicola]|uniref:Transposase n=1 Tax=Rhizobium oryzicola TaxID=1232668 RepID=A0ABT8SW66_9HYPH|nr:transposase [Rhizobium oryzicola]MDO1582673.1 transposase [Rhizobium oryzicola]
MNNGSFPTETSLEFLTTRKPGREVHRHWSDETKAKIVSESFRLGATVKEVAQGYGLRANSLSTWRTMARQGNLLVIDPTSYELGSPANPARFSPIPYQRPKSLDQILASVKALPPKDNERTSDSVDYGLNRVPEMVRSVSGP